MRIIESIAAIYWIVLGLPSMAFAWLGLWWLGIHPRFIRVDSDGLPAASGYLALNANDEFHFSRIIRATCMDLQPCFFEVILGRIRFKEAFSLLNRIGNERRRARGPQTNLQRLGLIALILVALGVLWLAYRG
jgi:hypothetical protein